MDANPQEQTSSATGGGSEPRVTKISSGSPNLTIVITHPRFLIVVPKVSFLHNPLRHAHRLKSDLLSATTPSHVSRANKPSIIGSFPSFLFRLLIMGTLVGLLIPLALISDSYIYGVLLAAQVLLSYQLLRIAIYNLTLDPSHIILSKESSLLHSRKGLFSPPLVLKLSSIRFFRMTVREWRGFMIRYGVEAVTTGDHFPFAFGTSQSGIAELVEVLNNYLQSSNIERPPPSVLGDVDRHTVSIGVDRQPMADQLPMGSRLTVQASEASLRFSWDRQGMVGSFLPSLVSLALWTLLLGLTLVSGKHSFSEMISNGFTIAGFALFIPWFIFLVYLSLTRSSLIFVDDNCTTTKRQKGLKWHMSTRTINLARVRQVQLIRKEAKIISLNTGAQGRVNLPESLGGWRYAIRFTKNDGGNLFEIRKLTEGEAMFILSQLRAAFPAHFEETA